MGASSLESLLRRAATRDDPALWHRQAGAWTPGGEAPGRDVRELAAALQHFGAGPGTSALVLGREGPDTSRASLAVLVAGACLVRLDAGVSDALLRHALEAQHVVLALVEDDHQLRRVLALRPDLPELEIVILLDAAPSERKAPALLVGAAADIGAARLDEDPSALERGRGESPGGATALLVPSGDRLRSLSADALAAAAERWTDEVSIGPGRNVLVALPPDGIESVPVLVGALARGATLLILGAGESLGDGLRQRPPDGAIVSASTLTRLYEEWCADFEGHSWWGRRCTRWALELGADPARRPRLSHLADALILSRVRRRWGGRLRGWAVLGDPATREISEFFASAGLPIYVMPGVAPAVVAR
ncbi:MAG TPA: AMP-binding protein [Candidatus Polarisedimenticolaceae bacterium]|nr:AMP-binding protein [Candidatus Polarisedimenticolaceae bacterium]